MHTNAPAPFSPPPTNHNGPRNTQSVNPHPRGERHERPLLRLVLPRHRHRLLQQLGLEALDGRARGAAQHLEHQRRVDGERDEVVVAALRDERARLEERVLRCVCAGVCVFCVLCVGVCFVFGQRAAHTTVHKQHTCNSIGARAANERARSSSRRTVLMRAHTCAPSVCSAVCTRQNCSGVISSEHERPNFSTVGRNARSSVIAPRCVKTPLNFILFACCRCCLSRLLLRGGGYCRGRLECGGGGLTPLAPAHYKFTACAARRAPPRTPPTAWGKTGAPRSAALLAGQRRENAPRSDAQPREALPCTDGELMTASDQCIALI